MVIALAGINPWKDGYLQITIIAWRKKKQQYFLGFWDASKMAAEGFQTNEDAAPATGVVFPFLFFQIEEFPIE